MTSRAHHAKTKTHHHRKKTAKVLVADTGGSTCFSDLRWKGGTAYFTFARDGYEDSLDMDRSEFKDWMNSDSLGGWYNS